MFFVGLNKQNIRDMSILSGEFYEYSMGNQVEVTTIKSINYNNFMAENLSKTVKQDKLMVKFMPSNLIYFSRDFIDGDKGDNYASCRLDTDENKVYIGSYQEYELKNGVLSFSGVLSPNNYIERERYILGNSKTLGVVKDSIKILSCGVRGDKILALYYVPSRKGIAIDCCYDSNRVYGISSATFKEMQCNGFKKLGVDDWFDGAKVKEISI